MDDIQPSIIVLLLLLINSAGSEPPQTLYVHTYVGKSVTLPCYTAKRYVDWKFQNDNVRRVVIARDSEVIDAWKASAEIELDGQGHHNLVIENPQRVDHSGTYTCIDDAGNGPILVVIKLTVWNFRSQYTVNAGQSILLPCFTDLRSPVDWTFSRNDDQPVDLVVNGAVAANDRKQTFAVQSTSRGEYSLVIADLQPANSGMYTCVEKQGGTGMTRHQFHVNVTQTDNVKLSAVIEFDTVAFSCMTEKNASIRWYFRATDSKTSTLLYSGNSPHRSGNKQVYSTADGLLNVLLVSPVSTSDVGIFSCSPEGTALERQQFELLPLISDKNECLTNNGGCHAHATCVNVPESFDCRCNEGWQGNGFSSCNDIDECADGGRCDVNADCINTPGSYVCRCNAGYTGDGQQCTDINECDRNNGGCHSSATCSNTPGSYTCQCRSGFSGDGITCTEHSTVVSSVNTSESKWSLSEILTIICVASVNAIILIGAVVLSVILYSRCRRKDRPTQTHERSEEQQRFVPSPATVGTNTNSTRIPIPYAATVCCCFMLLLAPADAAGPTADRFQTNVGQPISLHCYSRPGTAVDWTFLAPNAAEEVEIARDGIVINGWRRRVEIRRDAQDQFVLLIPRPLINETGRYYCINESGFGYRRPYELVVNDVQYSTTVGRPIMLPCFTNLSQPVDWTFTKFNTKDEAVDIVQLGVPINGWIRKATVESKHAGEFSLIIKNPQLDDTGLYTCIEDAGLGVGHLRHSVFLNVTDKIATTVTSAIDSQTVVFSCVARGNSRVRWMFQTRGSPMSSLLYNGYDTVDRTGRLEVRDTADKLLNILQINGVRNRDVGTYSCSSMDTALNKQYFELAQIIPDENECQNNNRCHVNAQCVNVPGTFYCTCKQGFVGDGIENCYDINECQTENGGCGKNAVCQNIPGSFTCQCPPGFEFDGSTCADVDECATDNGGCHSSATCTNTPGGRSCQCQAGLVGDGVTSCKVQESGSSFSTLALVIIICVLAILLLVTFAILIICLRKKRSRNSATSEDKSDYLESGQLLEKLNDSECKDNSGVKPPPTYKPAPPSLELLTSASEPSTPILGLCVHNDELYVLRDGKPIEVYDKHNLKIAKTLTFQFEGIRCAAFHPRGECIYYAADRSANTVHVASLLTGATAFEIVSKTKPDSIAVNPQDGRLIVVGKGTEAQTQLVEYEPIRREVAVETTLQSKIIVSHILPLTGKGGVLVCYQDDTIVGRRKIGRIDREGRLTQINSDMEHPSCIAEDNEGFIFVADVVDNRVALFDPEFKQLNDVVSAGACINSPGRMCFDEQCETLFVGEVGGGCRLLAYRRLDQSTGEEKKKESSNMKFSLGEMSKC